jgi:hypothetical protein
MANPKGGVKFKKGDPRINRKGPPKKPEDLKYAEKNLTKTILELKIKEFLLMDRDSLQSVIKDSKAPMIDVTLCSIIAKSATGADEKRLDWVISRLLGKVKEQVEVVLPRPMIVENLDGGQTLLTASDTINADIIEED